MKALERQAQIDALFGRVARLSDRGARVRVAGYVEGFPFFVVDVEGTRPDLPRVLLTGGVHGDEPAGVEAALRFADEARRWSSAFHFTILPCVNPTGYDAGTRENARGADLNRAFGKESRHVGRVLPTGGRESSHPTLQPEVELVMQVVDERRVDLAVDFHEDWEATGFYLYECARCSEPVGARVVESVRRIGALDRYGDGDVPLGPGVFRVSPECDAGGLVPYVSAHYGVPGLIFETPTRWAMERRVAAHHAALCKLLALYSRSQVRSA